MKKVLYLEDDELIRDVTVEYLKLAHFEITTAENGEEAYELFLRERFDFLILDIMVPGMNGLEVLKKVRSKDSNIGILMLSALGDEKTQIESFTELADDYIVKPASPILLLKRMETILRRSRYAVEMLHGQNGKETGFRIDKEGYAVYENGKNIGLTLTEFLIFSELHAHPKQVFSRNMLMDLVYGTDYFGNDRAVDSHIKNIRRKLEKNCIKTVIGVGYQFIGEEAE